MLHLHRKIFVVDDNNYYAELVARKLLNDGFENVTLFESGEACLAAIDQQPSLILLDCSMPGLSGLETLMKIKADNPEIHVVFLSFLENMALALDALRYGAFDIIIKDDKSLLRLSGIMTRILELEKRLELRN